MGIISALISLPVSIILVVWLARCKKRQEPFAKKDIVRLLAAGALSMAIAAVVTLAFTSVLFPAQVCIQDGFVLG